MQQDATIDPPPSRNDDTNQLPAESPVHVQFVQEPFGDIRFLSSGHQNHDQSAPYQPEDALVLPARNLPRHINSMIPLTPKMRIFFIISGILFLIFGAGALCLEVAIMMLSFSTYYRGIWAGNMMLATAISMLVTAGRTTHSIRYMRTLLAYTILTVIFGAAFSGVDMATIRPCPNKFAEPLCDSTTGKILKCTICGLMNISLLCIMFMLGYVHCVK